MGWVFLSWVGMIPMHVAVIGYRVNGGRERVMRTMKMNEDE